MGWSLDAFAGAPDQASRIAGLGGPEPATDPGYLFRTLPVACGVGAAGFWVRFEDVGGHGTVILELTATSAHPGAGPVSLKTTVTSVRELAEDVWLPFDAQRDMLYALSGYMPGVGDVTARGVAVSLVTAPLAPTAAPSGKPEGATSSVEAVDIVRLANLEPPSFGDPVSQPWTAEQSRHADALHWTAALDLTASEPASAWEQAFPAQVLSRYGALRPGARGLGLYVRGQSLPALLAARGCTVSAVDRAEHASDLGEFLRSLARPQICADERFFASVDTMIANHDGPALPGPFDFAWSTLSTPSPSELTATVCLALDRLRPGGMAVHVFPFRTSGDDPADGIGREVVERIALDVISFGNRIAQLKLRVTALNQGNTRPFGLVILKA